MAPQAASQAGPTAGPTAGSTRAKLHFSRFEFKYLLPEAVRDELETMFQYFVELDPYVSTKPDKKYVVRSLYFDNSAHVNYWEKEDGKKHRQKFRLRTYTKTPSDGTPRFLEIKGRHNNLVFKHRTQLLEEPRRDAEESFLWHPTTGALLGRLEDGAVREAFRFDLHKKHLQPVMLVDYLRRPYISKYDPEFRITFDDSLRGTATGSLDPDGRAVSRSVLSGYTILEVKFRYHVPKWFHRLIQTMELERVSISKYCACMRSLGVVQNPS
ncbi:VTC domain protein [Planctomycetes bacterium Poly30]|uniref:VTC domain protein n=2 Tax=Saltatorellus ferox TaxID=2528018 RepID=A0A518EM26_9BACT|nr:VTC domain protein [Planctomycetes bacterium Poly30]